MVGQRRTWRQKDVVRLDSLVPLVMDRPMHGI